MAKRGNADSRNLLIQNNMRFIKKTSYEVWSFQQKRNEALLIELDDLVLEGMLGLDNCIDTYDPGSENLFLTYAAPAIRNAMLDYIRVQNVSFEAKNPDEIISLDTIPKDQLSSRHNCVADPNRKTPEQIYLEKETIEEIHRALEMIDVRELRYLKYRFGFEDDEEHLLTETAKHFHLSESRARSTEALALDNVWLELPWWY